MSFGSKAPVLPGARLLCFSRVVLGLCVMLCGLSAEAAEIVFSLFRVYAHFKGALLLAVVEKLSLPRVHFCDYGVLIHIPRGHHAPETLALDIHIRFAPLHITHAN